MNHRTKSDQFQFSSGKGLSLYISICAAKGLQEIMKNNLGPNGTMKILVSSSGEIKISKDGSYLLKEMQIQNPTASLIAKTIVSQKLICLFLKSIFIRYITQQLLILPNF